LVYQVLGLVIPTAVDEEILLQDSTHSFKAFLSNNLDTYCADIDKRPVKRISLIRSSSPIQPAYHMIRYRFADQWKKAGDERIIG